MKPGREPSQAPRLEPRAAESLESARAHGRGAVSACAVDAFPRTASDSHSTQDRGAE